MKEHEFTFSATFSLPSPSSDLKVPSDSMRRIGHSQQEVTKLNRRMEVKPIAANQAKWRDSVKALSATRHEEDRRGEVTVFCLLEPRVGAFVNRNARTFY